MNRKKFLIGGVLALVAVVTVVAAGGAYVRSIDFDSYRPALVDELRAATGREVAIDGPVGFTFLPRPHFVVRAVAIANAPWGTRDTLARIDRVEAEIALLALLRGERRISRVRLVRPDLWFETDTVGKVNWILAGRAGPIGSGGEDGTSGSLLASLDVGRIDIAGGRITYRDGATGDITVLLVTAASVEGDGYSAPLALSFAGEWDTIPFALRGAVGPFNAVASDLGNASAVNLRLELGNATVRVDGAVGDPQAGPGATLRVSAKTTEPDRLARLFGIALPLAETVSLDANVRYRGARLDVEGADLTVGKRTATGTASVDLSKPRPVFTADIHAAETDMTGLVPARTASAVTAGEIGPLDALIGSGLLRMADGTVTVRSDVLRAGAMTLRDVNARIAVIDGGLVADPIRARSVGGALEGSVRVDNTSSPPRLSVSIKAPAFAAGPLLQHSGSIKAFGGVASLAANLTTAVGTPEAMLAGLEGEALLAMGEGRVTLEPHESPFATHVTGMASLIGLVAADGRQDVAIECVAGRMTVTGGVARSDGFILLSQDAQVKGKGRIDLAAGTLALRFMPEARKGPLLLEGPVSVSGSLGAPVVTLEAAPDPGGAVGDLAFYPLRRFFAGVAAQPAANACLRALPPAPRKRAPPGRPIAQRPDPAASGTVSSPIQPAPFATGDGTAE